MGRDCRRQRRARRPRLGHGQLRRHRPVGGNYHRRNRRARDAVRLQAGAEAQGGRPARRLRRARQLRHVGARRHRHLCSPRILLQRSRLARLRLPRRQARPPRCPSRRHRHHPRVGRRHLNNPLRLTPPARRAPRARRHRGGRHGRVQARRRRLRPQRRRQGAFGLGTQARIACSLAPRALQPGHARARILHTTRWPDADCPPDAKNSRRLL
mmetsp:Transcript_27973/g.65570  ORF Transcript_27973/g.65570 Transcript_27973/m.65570 type:complete len:212 (-) Transcript_27973:37-672(-)